MNLYKALTLSLGETENPVISNYQIGLLIYKLYKNRAYQGQVITNITQDFATNSDFLCYRTELVDNGILIPYLNAYKLFGRQGSREDIYCSLNPFGYISHLSAMSYHGLTNRIPLVIFVSSPNHQSWKEFARKRMQHDLGDDLNMYRENGLPPLIQIKIDKIGKYTFKQFNSRHLGAYKNVRGRAMRVSTIGRTFLDMLRNPELCGGIAHVLETFDNHAESYLRLITDEITQHGKPIDKVRAGYILDERLDLGNDMIDGWTEFAQRGGSRKLDPAGDYESRWSDKWKLSLNVFA